MNPTQCQSLGQQLELTGVVTEPLLEQRLQRPFLELGLHAALVWDAAELSVHAEVCVDDSTCAVESSPETSAATSPVLGFLANCLKQTGEVVTNPTPLSLLVATLVVSSVLLALGLWTVDTLPGGASPLPSASAVVSFQESSPDRRKQPITALRRRTVLRIDTSAVDQVLADKRELFTPAPVRHRLVSVRHRRIARVSCIMPGKTELIPSE